MKLLVVKCKVNKSYYQTIGRVKNRFKEASAMLSDIRSKLTKEQNYRSGEYAALMKKLSSAKSQGEKQIIYEEVDRLRKTGEEFTPAGQALKVRMDSLSNEISIYQYQLIGESIDPASYYLLWKDATYRAKEEREVVGLLMKAYPKFKSLFPKHPYTSLISDMMAGHAKVVPGNSFVDFSAPALDGKLYTLSEQIKGKVAVVDLWASWCGPCIAKAQALVPIYKKYKTKGFTIVGVAREFKNLDALKFRLSKEEFSWLQLTELNDENGIWAKYSVGDGGGVQVLVDQKGAILEINPSAEKVEQYLKKLL